MKKAVLIWLFILFLIQIFAQKTSAESFSLQVSPNILIFDSKGQSQKINLKNLGTNTIELSPTFYIIKDSGDKDGSVIIDKKDEKISSLISFRENGEDVSSIKIKPLESTQILLNYQPQEGIANRFFTIVWSQESASNEVIDDTTYTNLIPGNGIIVLIKDATIKPELPIVDIKSEALQKSGPIHFEAWIENPSEDIMIAKATISITNIINQNVAKIQFPTQYLLPKTKRYLLINGRNPEWNDKFLFGSYRASLEVNKTDLNHASEETTTFILPVMPILILAVIIFFSLSVYLRVRMRKK